jgi:hypothetical protein
MPSDRFEAARIRPRAYGVRVSGHRRFAWMRDRTLTEHELTTRGLHAAEHLGRDDPLWPGQLATMLALLAYFALPTQLTIGPNWPLPTVELAALAVLVVFRRGAQVARDLRLAAVGLVLLAALTNIAALGLLVHYLVAGGHAAGAQLIGGGLLIWWTNLLLFAVLYWELDRGGPVRPVGERPPVVPDFLFPQMTDPRFAAPGWKPGFADYFYVSLTNQTAFSPTDTMPLRLRIKLLMGVQGVAALVTTGVVVARAVNALG